MSLVKLREAKPVTVFCPIIGHEHYYAEVLFTEFLVEHNVAFAASEHAGPLFRRMFPDSDTAQKYGCGPVSYTHLTLPTILRV